MSTYTYINALAALSRGQDGFTKTGRQTIVFPALFSVAELSPPVFKRQVRRGPKTSRPTAAAASLAGSERARLFLGGGAGSTSSRA